MELILSVAYDSHRLHTIHSAYPYAGIILFHLH